ncbi:helix-turn-helix domain-containing protein [Roseomonas sp. 18066]|uniref:helix-turn-helix domain-containing protein n=1 Tax=Roseomonas sp. 18066 TaxID=2681412 RepID=UPI001F416504|nr:helix-turn-helix domain-containing protein [Roseomonas sp. 18066]
MISAKQIKAARVFLEWEQRDLAEKSGLSLPTIQRMEKLGMERSSVANARRVQAAMEAAGVDFIPENGGGAGVRLRKAELPGGQVAHPGFAATIGVALNSMPGQLESQPRAASPGDAPRGEAEAPED